MADTIDYSARLDQLWDYEKAQQSEARFRAEIARHASMSREALEARTQLARSLGLQRKFEDADRALDDVQKALPQMPPRLRVRYLLERGRIQNSSGKPEQAMPFFSDAVAASGADTLPESSFYRVDALHMLGIAAPEAQRLDWNLKALHEADASTDPRVRRWRASLLNNIGWHYHDAGQYAKALEYFEAAVPAWEARGPASNVRFARWAVARALRSLDRNDQALGIQQALVTETERAGEPDGFVYEEMGELALARGAANDARAWFAKAYALLKDDPNFVASEPKRLARLREFSQLSSQAPR